jgi:hypothetical protein
MSGRTRLTGREQPSPSLVQNWLKRFEASPDGSDVNHYVRISAPAVEARQFPDSFVAFLSVSRFFPADSLVLAQALRRLPRRSERLRCGRGSGTCGSWRRLADGRRSGSGENCVTRRRHNRIRLPIVAHFEPAHRTGAAFDAAMILLQSVMPQIPPFRRVRRCSMAWRVEDHPTWQGRRI